MRRWTRPVTAITTLLLAVGVLAAPASAHVTVNPNTASKGGFAKLTFRVPTEKDNASTVKLDDAFPTDHPLAFVSVKPHAGWTAKVQMMHLATPIKSDDGDVTDVVSQITWTADTPDAGIKPGYFDEFDVSVGPLPTNADALQFKAVQTYSDGDTVRWIEDRVAGGAEPQHPAPTLTLTAANASNATAATPAATSTTKTTSDSGKGLAIAALIVAIIAAVIAVIAAARKPRPTT